MGFRLGGNFYPEAGYGMAFRYFFLNLTPHMAGPLTISLNVFARSGLVLRDFEKSYLRYTGHEHRLRLQVNDEVDSLEIPGCPWQHAL